MKIAVLVDGIWTGEHDNLSLGHILTRQMEEDTDVAIMDTRPIRFPEDVKNLRGIVRLGVGYDNVPLRDLRGAGIIAAYTPNAVSQAVAEHALSLMMAGLRLQANRNAPGRMLSEVTVAVIGRGRIGKRFVAMLDDLNVGIIIVNDPVDDTTFDDIHKVRNIKNFSEAIRGADVISIHAPNEEATRDLINVNSLLEMKENAILVNTSRGGLVNEEDLELHLRENLDFVAALDVFKNEPYDGPLLQRRNCIHTPHVAAMTLPARRAMEKAAIEAAVDICEGRAPQWEIPDVEPWHKLESGKGEA